MEMLTELTHEEQRLIELFRRMEPTEQKLCSDLIEQMAQGILTLEKGSVINYGKIGCVGHTTAVKME